MKYKLVSGLKLQYGYTQTPNGICRKLLKGQEVKLKKEELAELESLGVKLEPTEKKKPSKKEEK
jgi:hypothetical protein|tara:strand:- start:1172 stop:1363 length:192 start_codon:yes stop_codon:yes gene_type:complete